MDQLRAALVADMRHRTAADPKGNRKMVIGALSVLAPTSPLRAKLARCGKRNPANDSREFCRRPCCGVCMQRQARWLFREAAVAGVGKCASHTDAMGHDPDASMREPR